LALGAALLAARAGTGLLYQALYFTSLFTGPLLALTTLAFYRPQWQPRSVMAGAFMGMLLLVLFSPPEFLNIYKPIVAWPYNPLISCLGTWLGAGCCQWIWPVKLK
jgi:solute:Na+ symporter, SSS family